MRLRHNPGAGKPDGCFYVESPAMQAYVAEEAKAKTYLDLVAASSIIRPGWH